MNPSSVLLSLRGICKSFPSGQGEVHIIRNLDLDIREGEFVAITGPSGSGKTTLLHMAALLEPPSSGQVFFDGQDMTAQDDDALSHSRKHKVGMVFQSFCLLPHRSALENVLFRFRYLEGDRAGHLDRAREVISSMGLDYAADRTCRVLSGGEMQRVAIARALALRPRLLVADEPTGNLDADSADSVMRCFRQLHEDGHTILMVTHNRSLLSYCSREVKCEGGRLVTEAA